LKIVFQHDRPLPVKKYGGIERILLWHMKELARLGHKVILIGHPESNLSSFGIETVPMQGKEWHHLIPDDSDIIHLTYNHIVPSKIPTIITLHGNGQPDEIFPENTVFLSDKHAKNHGGEYFIYNSLDLQEYPFIPRERDWNTFLFLAKASWKVKNLSVCLKAIKESDKKLNVIGGSSLIPKKNTRFHGFLDGSEKLEVMRSSDALLYPVKWHEPFGLAVIEAMSQGLPVLTSPFGSLPELVTEETGKVVNNYEELLSCIIDRPRPYSSTQIRNYVEKNFSINRYSTEYCLAYEKVIAGEKIHHTKLTWQFEKPPEDLLEF
jgi:glycosyltransferase involved in cell wall biosynthesis